RSTCPWRTRSRSQAHPQRSALIASRKPCSPLAASSTTQHPQGAPETTTGQASRLLSPLDARRIGLPCCLATSATAASGSILVVCSGAEFPGGQQKTGIPSSCTRANRRPGIALAKIPSHAAKKVSWLAASANPSHVGGEGVL